MEKRSIAIDGPSGAGKSTLARMTALDRGMIYVDTGALYRSIGLFVLRNDVSSKDKDKVISLLPRIDLDMKYDDSGTQRVILCDEDVTDEIRTPIASIYASDVSAIPQVRDFLLDMQREMAEKYDVIMDGRDIGTVVLPNCGLKVFLNAKPEIRAKRRFDELLAAGRDVTFDEVLKDINYRDHNDSTRESAPLMVAEDAVVLDTTDLNLEESFDKLEEIIDDKLGTEK